MCDKNPNISVQWLIYNPNKIQHNFSGRASVLTVLHKHNADFTVLKKQTGETVLHRLLLREMPLGQPLDQWEASLTFLLNPAESSLKGQVDKIINKKDAHGNTALHYATQKWSQVW